MNSASGTNKINNITDLSKKADGYPVTEESYTYDKCGNPTYDPSKMAYITYSRYNKPLEVSASATDKVRYSYTSTGTKLRREVTSMSSAADGVTDYSYNFLYEDNELVCIFAPFGRVTPMNTSNGNKWRYHYTIADHLGNARVEFVAHGGAQPEVVQTSSYYPFGMTLRRNDFGLINMNGRMYDPLVGRMLSPDIVIQDEHNPQAYNSYSYCLNNPLRFTDPSGYVVDWYEKNGKIIWDDNVTCAANTPEGETYIGYNDKDILKYYGLKEKYEKKSASRFGISLSGVSMESDHNGKMYPNQSPWLAPTVPSDNVKGYLTTSAVVSYNTDEASGTNKQGKTFEGITFRFTLSQSHNSLDFKGNAGIFYDDKFRASHLEQWVESSIEKEGYQYTKAHISIPADDIKSKGSFKNAQIRVGAVSNSFFISPRPVEMNWNLYVPDTNPKHYTFKYYFLYEK